MAFQTGQTYVAPGPGGTWDVVINGQLQGRYENQQRAEQEFNTYMGAFQQRGIDVAGYPTGVTAGGGGGGGGTVSTFPSAWFDAAQAAAMLEYYNRRLSLLEIPEMQARTELARKQLAMQSALSYSEMMGWVIAPGDLENALNRVTQATTYNVTWPDGTNRTLTASDLRDALQQSGYPNWQNATADELQRIFTQTSGAQVTSQLAAGAQIGTGLPTFQRELAMAEMATQPGRFLNFLSMAGATPQQTAGFLNQLPYVQGLQGYGLMGQVQPTAGGGNPLFPFISGRQLPARSTLELQQQQSPLIPFTSSLAAFSGQTPESFWGEFESFLPKGAVAPITGVA